MPIFIKTGYWKKASESLKGWLNLDLLIKDLVPSYTITDDELDAISGANSPSSTNTFVTESDTLLSINDQTGTTYTIQLTDEYVRCSNANTIIVYVPLNSTIAFPIGTVVTIEQKGAGTVVLQGASPSVTINGELATNDQYYIISLIKVATNEWTAVGGIEYITTTTTTTSA